MNTGVEAGDFGDESNLVQRLRAGDEDAFAEVVRALGGRLLATARRLLGNDDDARDAVQDAFLSSFKSLDGFEGESRLYTWIHRIVVNTALMKLRSRQRKPEESLDELLPQFYEDGHRIDPGREWRETAQEELGRKEIRELVLSNIKALPDSYREVLILRDIEQLDTETTARIIGADSNLVRVRLHRARQALRTRLDPHFRVAP